MIDITTGISLLALIIIIGAMLLPIRTRLDKNEVKIDDMNKSLTIIKGDIRVMGEKIGNIEKSMTGG